MHYVRLDHLPPCSLNEYQIEAVLEEVEDAIRDGFSLPEAVSPQTGVELVLNQAMFLLRQAFFEDMYDPDMYEEIA